MIADQAVEAILTQAEKIAALDLKFRPGSRAGTRECVMTGFPYTLGYLTGAREVRFFGYCISARSTSTDG